MESSDSSQASSCASTDIILGTQELYVPETPFPLGLLVGTLGNYQHTHLNWYIRNVHVVERTPVLQMMLRIWTCIYIPMIRGPHRWYILEVRSQ